MRATDVYGASIESNTELTTSPGARSVRPGVGSWATLPLSLLFFGIFTVTWILDEQTMVWLLSHHIVDESATRTLPDTLRRASLVMAGMATDMCVETTARDAADRGYNVIVVEDAVATFFAEHHRAALSALARVYTQVWSASRVLSALQG